MVLVIELHRARERIKPLEALLSASHEAAAKIWRETLTERPKFALPLDKTTRANILHNHLEAEVARRVEPLTNVAVADGLGFFALRIDEYILIRLKYVGCDGAPHNVATTQQRLLARQTYDEDMVMALNGDLTMAPPTLLTCGYTLTDEHELGRIEIRRDCKGHLPWRYEIYGGSAIVEPIFIDGMADDTKPAVITSERKRKGQGEAESA